MKEELGKKGIAEEDDATSQRTTRQLRDLCRQHQIPMQRPVENIIERNRVEIELELRSQGILTKGKNKQELVDLCRANDIACMRTAEKSRRVGWEKQRGHYKCCGSKVKLTAQGSSRTHLPERRTNMGLLLTTA
jgi:hypothetical protein